MARLYLTMQEADPALLAAAVRDLREMGADVERLYAVARQRYPSVPPLRELVGQPR